MKVRSLAGKKSPQLPNCRIFYIYVLLASSIVRARSDFDMRVL